VMLVAEGKQVPVIVTPVTDSGDTAYLIDWSSTPFVEGSTSLTVYTSDVSNTEGTTGTMSKNKTWNAVSAIVSGDVDGDGEITAQDASLILQLVAGKITAESLIDEAADVDGDEEVTAQDASLILQHVAGKIIIGD